MFEQQRLVGGYERVGQNRAKKVKCKPHAGLRMAITYALGREFNDHVREVYPGLEQVAVACFKAAASREHWSDEVAVLMDGGRDLNIQYILIALLRQVRLGKRLMPEKITSKSP